MIVPQRIQLSRARGWRQPEGTVRCTRPGKWGNPVVIHEVRSQQPHVFVLLDASEDYAYLGQSEDRETAVLCAIMNYKQRLLRGELRVTREDVLRELSQAPFLGCWCPMGSPCHVYAYIAILEGKL